jgi:hypothetical protein
MASYVHVVLFTFHPDTPEPEVQAMIRDAYRLAAIPAVRQLHCGRRDDSIRRPVSDTSYHVGLLVCFDDRQAYDTYAAHPDHTAFVARYKPLWADIRVCDFIAPD